MFSLALIQKQPYTLTVIDTCVEIDILLTLINFVASLINKQVKLNVQVNG